jgi:hypothetical protein
MRPLFKAYNVYKWILNEDFTMQVPAQFPLPDFENEWVTVQDQSLLIKKGYAWDGCSPKWIFMYTLVGVWDGFSTPDGKQEAYTASLVHDALHQFKVGERLTMDKLFLHLLEGFIFRYPYYWMTRLFGGFFF